jgi:beta-glucosidase
MFATGMENSAPTIRQGTLRVNEMERCGHYRRWREDFELVRELGTWPPDRFEWTFRGSDILGTARDGHRAGRDLCHFGVPGWIGNTQYPFPELFDAYARAFAGRYPRLQLYTPVNEATCGRTPSSSRANRRRNRRTDPLELHPGAAGHPQGATKDTKNAKNTK